MDGEPTKGGQNYIQKKRRNYINKMEKDFSNGD